MNPAFSNAARARMSARQSPESGGDRYGTVHGQRTAGVPTSRGRNTANFQTDRKGADLSQSTHPAHNNMEHASFTPKRGNSEGRAEVASKTTTGAVRKAAQARLGAKKVAVISNLAAQTSQPFKPESKTFGAVRAKAGRGQ